MGELGTERISFSMLGIFASAARRPALWLFADASRTSLFNAFNRSIVLVSLVPAWPVNVHAQLKTAKTPAVTVTWFICTCRWDGVGSSSVTTQPNDSGQRTGARSVRHSIETTSTVSLQ